METGDTFPEFDLPTNGGGSLSLSDLSGKWAVIYFYPKDLTPGCTTEAINFSDMKDEFEKLGAVIIGVSKDSPKRHDKFVEKHELGITLLSDEDGELCEACGVWVLKKLYGREYMGIERSTFLVAPDGTVRHIWPKVKVKDHAQSVFEVLKSETDQNKD